MVLRSPRTWLRPLAFATLLLSAIPAAANCPPVSEPLRCITYDVPLAGAPIPADRVEVVYLHLPYCNHCAAIDPAVDAVFGRENDLVVKKRLPIWTPPEKFTIAEPSIADVLLELHGRPSTDHDALVEDIRRNRWTRERAEAFFTQRGFTRAQLEKDTQSFGVRSLVQRRSAFEKAARADQVPFAVVNRRYALTYDPTHRADPDPGQFTAALTTLIASARGGPVASSSSPPPPVPATTAQAAYVRRPMPMPPDLLPAPANAAAQPPRKCPSGGVRTQPKDLVQKDEMARRMMTQLRMWGAKHFRFDGPAGCTDYDFVISQWQAMVGLPQTGVLDAAVVKSVVDAVTTMQPQLLAAQRQWSEARVAARDAGLDPDTGLPPTAAELERRRRIELARGPQSAPATFVRPAPVGPIEKQVFGFSLGQPFSPQLPVCPWRSGWGGGLDYTHTCQYRLDRIGASSSNWLTPFEAQRFTETVRSAAEAPPDPDGLVAISFADDERPGLSARPGIRGLLVAGRLEGIGFIPTDRESVLEVLESRYGPPVRVPVAMQNESGAQWSGWRYEFRRNDVTATINCVTFGSTSCSFVEVLTPAGRAAFGEWRKREAHKGTTF